jgi:hypothetical protein
VAGIGLLHGIHGEGADGVGKTAFGQGDGRHRNSPGRAIGRTPEKRGAYCP